MDRVTKEAQVSELKDKLAKSDLDRACATTAGSTCRP